MKIVEEEQNWAMMPKLPADYILTSFDEATTVYADRPNSDRGLYAVDIKRDWAIGNSMSSPCSPPQWLAYIYSSLLLD
jgi:hypothetical protein